jgi:hypothetical protein
LASCLQSCFAFNRDCQSQRQQQQQQQQQQHCMKAKSVLSVQQCRLASFLQGEKQCQRQQQQPQHWVLAKDAACPVGGQQQSLPSFLQGQVTMVVQSQLCMPGRRPKTTKVQHITAAE